MPLLGEHQRDDATLAVAAMHALADGESPVSEPAIRHGLAHAYWPGRIQVLPTRPTMSSDGAHNVASAEVLRATLAQCFPGRPITLILGCTADKDLAGIVDALVPGAVRVVATRADHPRAVAAATAGRAARRAAPRRR